MRVALLGPVSAESGGTALGLGGLKQRAVFALLALNARRVVSLDRLVEELWPEEPPSRATLGLQSYVSRLRRLLATAAAGDPEVPELLTRPPGWVLDLDPALVDVTRFEELVARARHAAGPDSARLLREALGLWRGEPLADLQSLPFAREEAARLTEVHLAAQELAVEAALAAGDAPAAVAAGHRFVAANPFRERAWRALALGLYRSGRQSEALAALARLRRTLADELGLDPSPETGSLETGMLQHDPALTLLPPPEAPPGGSPVADRDDDALLGRAAALALVDRAVASSDSGRGTLLVLEAAAGSGKTTLLGAVADRVAAAGGHAVRASGVGAGAMPALWPWVTIVRQVAGLMPTDAPPSPDDAAGHALSIMHAGGPASVESSGAPSGSRTRLYRGIVDLLLAARGRGPLAVVLDDLQWVDADTLTLLALAVEQLVDHGVLFAVAVRTGEPGADEAAATLHQVRRDVVVGVPVPGLALDDVAALVRRLSARPVEPPVAAAIHERTLGNPFFVGELVRLLVSEQRLDPAAVHEALPAEVEDVLRRRLDRLPQQTIALLAVAALASGPIEVETLATVTGLDADAVLDACESALLAELLVEEGPGFSLRHDLVRQTLERGMSHARRVRLHARLADALRARPALTPEQVVAVARHLSIAEPVVGAAAPIPYLVTAADDALSRHAHRESVRLLEQALDLASRVSDPDERSALAVSVRGRLAIVRAWGLGTIAEGGSTGEELADPAMAESTHGWVAALVTRGVTGRYHEVVAIAERALEAQLTPAARAGASFVAGWAQFLRGRLDDAQRHLRAFEELDEASDDRRQSAPSSTLDVAAAGYAALVAHALGDEAGADRADRLARTRATGRAQPNGMEADLYGAVLAAMRGDAEGCRARAGACARTAAELGYPLFGLHAAVLIAWADAVLGAPDGAARADEAYARYTASGVLMFAPLYLLLRAEAHAVAGRRDRAAVIVAESRARSAELGDVCRAPRLLALAEDLTEERVQGLRKP